MHLKGSKSRVTLLPLVLVDEAAESVATADLALGPASPVARPVRAAGVRARDAASRGCSGRRRRGARASRWRRLRISSQSRHSARTVRTKRSAIAFAFGARTGVFTIRMPSLRKTSSKGPLYLLSRSRIRNRTPWSEKSRPRLRACWVTQSPVGLAVQPASQTRLILQATEFSANLHANRGSEHGDRDPAGSSDLALYLPTPLVSCPLACSRAPPHHLDRVGAGLEGALPRRRRAGWPPGGDADLYGRSSKTTP